MTVYGRYVHMYMYVHVHINLHVQMNTCKVQLSAVGALDADNVASSDDDGDDVMAPPVVAAGLSPTQVAPAAAAAGTDMYMYGYNCTCTCRCTCTCYHIIRRGLVVPILYSRIKGKPVKAFGSTCTCSALVPV